jgi:hypothetical protein
VSARLILDRVTLVGTGALVSSALAWLAFHPLAMGALQAALVLFCVSWRFQLLHRGDRGTAASRHWAARA